MLLSNARKLAAYGSQQNNALSKRADGACDTTSARAFCQRAIDALIDTPHQLVFAIASFPESGRTVDGLISASQTAAHQANASSPITVAPTRGRGPLEPAEDATETTVVIRSPAMRQLYERIARVASTPVPILILGETGVGKEMVARRLHQESERRHLPMGTLNCGAISPNLVEPGFTDISRRRGQ